MHAVHLNAYIVPSPVYDSDLYRFIIAQLHIHFHAWLFQFGKGASCIIGTYHTYHCDPLRAFVLSKPSSLLVPPETGATSKGETPTFVLEQD